MGETYCRACDRYVGSNEVTKEHASWCPSDSPHLPDRGGWLQTVTGKQLHPWDARPAELDALSLARGLLEPRFSGQTRRDVGLYTVAEHCVRGSLAIDPDDALAFLLHDAHEWPFRDLGAPLKRHPALAGYRAGAEAFQRVVNAWAGLETEAHHRPAVKRMDMVMLATEKASLMGPEPAPWVAMPDPLPGVIVPWPAAEAEMRFRERLYELTGGRLA